MKVTQVRNATVLIEFQSSGTPIGLLVDPMLARSGALPSLRYFAGLRRRNPLVNLPDQWPDLAARVTHGLITHCQRGHFDHLDRAGTRFLRDAGVPVFCTPRDTEHLRGLNLKPHELHGSQRQPFFHGHITAVPCVHGHGWVGRLMEHGSGYLIELPGEPSLYIAGDTVLSPDVTRILSERQPAVAILPAGGAQLDIGTRILMDGDDVLAACAMTPGVIIANHLEALDHCPTSRATLAADGARAGFAHRLRIPQDGETLVFQA